MQQTGGSYSGCWRSPRCSSAAATTVSALWPGRCCAAAENSFRFTILIHINNEFVVADMASFQQQVERLTRLKAENARLSNLLAQEENSQSHQS